MRILSQRHDNWKLRYRVSNAAYLYCVGCLTPVATLHVLQRNIIIAQRTMLSKRRCNATSLHLDAEKLGYDFQRIDRKNGDCYIPRTYAKDNESSGNTLRVRS
ncbi:hypothetical protein NIES25_19970 [Nostoc linckia NIES-25]|nr:hypothetical protein NIES25_19970 [Nostoc linckia NIES-25]